MSRRCSRDTYPESYITKYTSVRRQYVSQGFTGVPLELAVTLVGLWVEVLGGGSTTARKEGVGVPRCGWR